MNHNRVKELKGTAGKKPSRKAVRLGRAGDSPMASLLNSPASSANPSRVTSDVSEAEHDLSEDDIDFDDTASLFTSSDLDDPSTPATSFNPAALLAQLQDRKHNNSETREKYLEVYMTVLRSHYTLETHDWLELSAQSLASLFLRDANRGPTATERLLSLQAYCLTVSTANTLEIFPSAKSALQQILLEDDDDDCRVQAVYSLCATTIFSSDGSQDAVTEITQYLLEIVQSDGESVEAYDNIPVVIAALQCWCFVASFSEDVSAFADEALSSFVDQLDSADLEIQAAAACCIAFIFEASRAEASEREEDPYDLLYAPQRLLPKLRNLTKLSAKSVSRKDRRALRESLMSVATSLEREVGPGYSTALSTPTSADGDEGQVEYGYRKKLRLDGRTAIIDTWALEIRVTILKHIYKSSLHRHAFTNENVVECLDIANFDSADGGDVNEGYIAVDKPSRKSRPKRKQPGVRGWEE